MMRRYKGKWHRFAQPDRHDGSYNLSDPQSFNRYPYVQNDPVNLVDPSGLDPDGPCTDESGRPVDCGPDIAPEDTVQIYTFSPYFVILFFAGDPLLLNFPNRTPDPTPRQPVTQPPTQPTEPRTPPPCDTGGSGDIGLELITPVFVGPKGGIQLDGRGNAYPYFGLAAGTPGKGASITVNTSNVTPGLSVGFSGGAVIGVAYSANLPWDFSLRSLPSHLLNGTWSFGGTTPGASVNLTVTLAPEILQQNLCR